MDAGETFESLLPFIQQVANPERFALKVQNGPQSVAFGRVPETTYVEGHESRLRQSYLLGISLVATNACRHRVRAR